MRCDEAELAKRLMEFGSTSQFAPPSFLCSVCSGAHPIYFLITLSQNIALFLTYTDKNGEYIEDCIVCVVLMIVSTTENGWKMTKLQFELIRVLLVPPHVTTLFLHILYSSSSYSSSYPASLSTASYLHCTPLSLSFHLSNSFSFPFSPQPCNVYVMFDNSWLTYNRQWTNEMNDDSTEQWMLTDSAIKDQTTIDQFRAPLSLFIIAPSSPLLPCSLCCWWASKIRQLQNHGFDWGVMLCVSWCCIMLGLIADIPHVCCFGL